MFGERTINIVRIKIAPNHTYKSFEIYNHFQRPLQILTLQSNTKIDYEIVTAPIPYKILNYAYCCLRTRSVCTAHLTS